MGKAATWLTVIVSILLLLFVEQTIYAYTLHCPAKVEMKVIPRCLK